MLTPVASVPNLGGPDLIVMALIIAVLAAPGLIAIPIVLYLERRRRKPPPLPTDSERAQRDHPRRESTSTI